MIGVFPLILPATAGAMFVARLLDQAKKENRSQPSRAGWGSLVPIASMVILLMFSGEAINWLLYRNLAYYYPYFQSTLQFLALAFILVGFCSLIHFGSLFALAGLSLWITFTYSELRFTDQFWAKVFFASDGRQFLWPLFPWVGIVALGGGLQWKKDFFSQPKLIRLNVVLASLAAAALIHLDGWPLLMNPANMWGEGIFQKGGTQGLTLMVIYFLFWNLSIWASRNFPPRRFGFVHVLGQGIFYAYFANLALSFFGHDLLERFGHADCLAIEDRGVIQPCLQIESVFLYTLVFIGSWAFAWFMCRYFMNSRIRIRLRRIEGGAS
jgi:hypothetical protein